MYQFLVLPICKRPQEMSALLRTNFNSNRYTTDSAVYVAN